jgi:hypothetical protein
MPRPVYWKPKYGTRSMRHRAWVRQEQKRSERLEHASANGFWSSLRARLAALKRAFRD